MSMRSAAKRQKTEQKASQQPHNPVSLAQSLSTSLLLHLMRFLDDFRSLARMQSVCRNWSVFTSSQLDLCWRPLYLRDWEAESATDDCILTSGELTPWNERYRQRLRVEQNWKSGKSSTTRTTAVRAMKLACNASQVAVGCHDGWILLLDHNGNELRQWQPHYSWIKCMQFDGDLLATGAHDLLIKISDCKDGTVTQTLRGHDNEVAVLSKNGSQLASGDINEIRIWDLSSSTCTRVIPCETLRGLAMNWSAGLIVASTQGALRLFDLASGSERTSTKFHALSDLEIDASTGRLFGCSTSDDVFQIEFSDGKLHATKLPTMRGSSIRVRRGLLVASDRRGRQLIVHDKQTLQSLSTCSAVVDDDFAVSFRRLFRLDYDETLHILDFSG